MLRGEWRLSWDAIAFDEDGHRRNGKHRLLAFLLATETKAELRVPFLVLSNVSSEAVDVSDQGAKRTMGQVLRMRGVEGAAVLAPALRLMWQFLNGHAIGARRSDAAPDVSEMLAVLDEHPGLRDHVTIGGRLRRDAPLGSDGLSVLLAYLFTRIAPDEAEVFLDRLCTGVDLEEGDAILALRQELQKLHGRTATSKGIDVTYKAALVINAWNRWVLGLPTFPKDLRWRRGGARPEPFPVIEVPVTVEAE